MQFSGFVQLAQQFHEPLKPLVDLARAVTQFYEPILPVAKELSKLPERNREALQTLAEEGWFFHPEISLIILWKIDYLLLNDPKGISEWLCDFFREHLIDIEQELLEAYPHRKRPLQDAFEAHREGKYSLSVLAFLTHADGIFLGKSFEKKSLFITEQRKEAVEKYASQISVYDSIYLYPLEISLPLWKPKGNCRSYNQLNRHVVLHGLSVDYDTEENSLKAVSLLSYLHWILNMNEEEESSK